MRGLGGGGGCGTGSRRSLHVLRCLRREHNALPTTHKPVPAFPCRHVYTTPKSFLAMTKLYKSLLAGKRATVTASIQRLEAGLAKLVKTQGDVDVLVEQARAIAVEVRCGVGGVCKASDRASALKQQMQVGEHALARSQACLRKTACTVQSSSPHMRWLLAARLPAGGGQGHQVQQVCRGSWCGEGEGAMGVVALPPTTAADVCGSSRALLLLWPLYKPCCHRQTDEKQHTPSLPLCLPR